MHLDMPLRYRVLYGLVGFVLLASVAVIAIAYGSGQYLDGYKLNVIIARSAQGLDTKSDVKVRGVTIGTVNVIALNDDGTSTITLFMKPGTQISKSAQISVEPLSIFGPKYIRVEQGADEGTDRVYQKDETIGLDHTTPNTEFTEVLGNATKLLQHIDPQELVTILRNVADGVAGLGPAFAATLDNVGVIGTHLEADIPTFHQLLPNLANIASTLADNADSIVATANHLHELLPDLSGRTDAVTGLLEGLIPLSTQLGPFLREHQAGLDGTLTGLERVVGTLHNQLDQVPDFITALDLFFSRVGAVIRYPFDPYLIGTTHAVMFPEPLTGGPPLLCRILAGGACPIDPEFPR